MSQVEMGVEVATPGDVDLKGLADVSHSRDPEHADAPSFEAFDRKVAFCILFQFFEGSFELAVIKLGRFNHQCSRIILDHISEQDTERRQRTWRSTYDDLRNP